MWRYFFVLLTTIYPDFRTANAQPIDQAVESTELITTLTGIGSGVLLSPNHIVTNAHVIDDSRCEEIQISWRDKATNRCEKIIAVDSRRDIAVLRLQTVEKRQPLMIADFQTISVGDEVRIIGNPKKQLFVVSSGIVSSKEDRFLISGYDISNSVYFSIDANLNHGNSGGPVLNKQLAVVGIATYLKRDINGSAFALRSDQIMSFLKEHHVSFTRANMSSKNGANSSFFSFLTGSKNESDNNNEKINDEHGSSASTNDGSSEGKQKSSDWSGVANPFSFGGFKLAGMMLGGINYGDYSANDSGLKEKYAGKFATIAAQGFFGAQIGLEGRGSSTFGAWYTSLVDSAATARNTYYEQKSENPLDQAAYEAYLADDVVGEASRMSGVEREFGAYFGNFWRVSAGVGKLSIDIADSVSPNQLQSSGSYKVLTTGFLLGSSGWGASFDISKLYGGYYRRTALRATLGIGYTFQVFN